MLQYTHTHTHTHTLTHSHTHTLTHSHTHTLTHSHTHTLTHSHTHTLTHSHTHTYTNLHIYMRAHTHIHTYNMHGHTHIHTYTHIPTCAHTHTNAHARTHAHTYAQQIYTCSFWLVKHYPVITYFRSRFLQLSCPFFQQMHQLDFLSLVKRSLHFTTNSLICDTHLKRVITKQLLFGINLWTTSSQTHQGTTTGKGQSKQYTSCQYVDGYTNELWCHIPSEVYTRLI